MASEIVKHHFVLVHGAWHGAWCWVKLVQELEKAGHRVTTVDLLAAGNNREVDADDITSPEEYDGPLVKIFESFPDDEKVVVVGHSLGGLSIGRMSEKYPDKISVAVYFAGIMPVKDLQKFQDIMSDLVVLEKGGIIFGLDTTPKSALLPTWIYEENFYNKCSPEDIAYAKQHMRPVPLICMTPPTYLTEENYGRVPRVYVIARDDKAIEPKVGRKMIDNNPPTACVEIDGDHSLFFCSIPASVKTLSDIADEYDRH